VSGKRVLRLMRTHGLLAPRRLCAGFGPPNGNPARDGKIITDRPGVMWGTDGSRFYTEQEGWCWSSAPSITISAKWSAGMWRSSAIAGRRWSRSGRASAMRSGGSARRWPGDSRFRCDWGPQYIADAWINEVKWLGCTISPSYVGESECNGVAERFMRTLKEQCIYLHEFRSLEEARRIIAAFIAPYNTEWLIERLGHRTPAQARADAQRKAA